MYSLILTSAGSGKRMGLDYNKMLYKHNDQYIFNYALKPFLEFDEISEIFIVVSEQDFEFISNNLIRDPRIKVILGGAERQDSIYNATKLVTNSHVLIHDGARCFINSSIIRNLINELNRGVDNVAVGIKNTDSVREVINGFVVELLDRDLVYKMQTPQCFNTKILLKCQEEMNINKEVHTDEVGLVFSKGHIVKIIDGDECNIKLTTKKDLGALNELI